MHGCHDLVFRSFERLDEAADLRRMFGMPSAQLLDPACAILGLSGLRREDLLLRSLGSEVTGPLAGGTLAVSARDSFFLGWLSTISYLQDDGPSIPAAIVVERIR